MWDLLNSKELCSSFKVVRVCSQVVHQHNIYEINPSLCLQILLFNVFTADEKWFWPPHKKQHPLWSIDMAVNMRSGQTFVLEFCYFGSLAFLRYSIILTWFSHFEISWSQIRFDKLEMGVSPDQLYPKFRSPEDTLRQFRQKLEILDVCRSFLKTWKPKINNDLTASLHIQFPVTTFTYIHIFPLSISW